MSLKGDTFVGKLQDMVVVIDSEVIIKVKTSGFGIDKELNGRTVKDRKENRGEDSRNICETKKPLVWSYVSKSVSILMP